MSVNYLIHKITSSINIIIIKSLFFYIMNGDDPDAEDYCIAAMEGILILYSVDPAIISGIIVATKRIAQENGKLNSDGYQDVANDNFQLKQKTKIKKQIRL